MGINNSKNKSISISDSRSRGSFSQSVITELEHVDSKNYITKSFANMQHSKSLEMLFDLIEESEVPSYQALKKQIDEIIKKICTKSHDSGSRPETARVLKALQSGYHNLDDDLLQWVNNEFKPSTPDLYSKSSSSAPVSPASRSLFSSPASQSSSSNFSTPNKNILFDDSEIYYSFKLPFKSSIHSNKSNIEQCDWIAFPNDNSILNKNIKVLSDSEFKSSFQPIKDSSPCLYKKEKESEDLNPLNDIPEMTPKKSDFSTPIISICKVSLKFFNKLEQMLTNVNKWDFDINEMDLFSNNHPLFVISYSLFNYYDLFNYFSIDKPKFYNFLLKIESLYNNNPYHNHLHAADVLQATSHFIQNGLLNVIKEISKIDILTLLISAICHDLDHPGTTNQFQINTNSAFAMLYNDHSVLENHHASLTSSILRDKKYWFIPSFDSLTFNSFRKKLLQLIISTDLALHFGIVSEFRTRIQTHDINYENKETHRLLVMKVILKISDISHFLRPLPIHLKWSSRVFEEFYQQGDVESVMGLDISPFCDRNCKKEGKSQSGFMDVLLRPLTTIVCKYFQKQYWLEMLEINYKYWQKRTTVDNLCERKDERSLTHISRRFSLPSNGSRRSFSASPVLLKNVKRFRRFSESRSVSIFYIKN